MTQRKTVKTLRYLWRTTINITEQTSVFFKISIKVAFLPWAVKKWRENALIIKKKGYV